MNTTKVGELKMAGVEPGALYVLRSRIACRFDGDVEVLHVMSRFAGGEIRGYKRDAGSTKPWSLRLPCTPADWPEVDAATAALLRETVNGAAPSAQEVLAL